MYSGSTLTPFSGNIMGAHQKLDRVARHHLSKILEDDSVFPRARKITHFEGNKGPDAIKRKSPSKDEPWHFYSPFDDNDSTLIELIEDHQKKLISEIKNGSQEKIAFEAAWLAHAVTDGLTPAHHYPYEKELKSIWGVDHDSRSTKKSKFMPPADTVREQLNKSWKAWGPKGLISMHSLFELGVATIIAPISMKESLPTEHELSEALVIGQAELFKRAAREVAVLDMYERFLKKGWTPRLVVDTRQKLGPIIAKTITLSWYISLVKSKAIDIKK